MAEGVFAGVLGGLAEVLGEIFLKLIWKYMLRPVFFYSGFALQILFNLFRKVKADPNTKASNTAVGIITWCILIATSLILKYK
ncbi:MAG: hypothetical protein ACJ76F_00660 [Bacteroidia bacterium]